MKANNEQYAMELIIAKVKEGDMAAFNVLIDEHKAMAFTLALKLMKNREDAEEVAQDAFLKAYKNIQQFQGSSKFSTWLYTIVYNTALTKLRKKKIVTTDIAYHNEEKLSSFSESDKEWHRLQKAERSGYIKQALDLLSSDDQIAITLFYLNENSLQEICEITNWELSNVKVRLHRARKRLLKVLEQLLDTEVRSLL
ncbi:RNA polymerase sigma factor [Roseivirga sp.]|uniref:RNA polymerase sigma factor n=1 Tax=Roseivirga sp. TaxID=1964215 RepID=UPI003B8B5BA1